ncbi:TetR/AcrR family transcriptional regulator [Thermoactinomyces daqus]|uniref:TetR/AcrR family transcriptional regulator n=1 Tax=Thermoactinomyces daqus TaxID=1329516 RepID=A0A7W2AHT1_9BACL|nr:TetR/AcrR family transcriptional regulator [Thermoactinomyces daqus]MBA4543537.1 TetR/AcrR family transcriptional regulator [Thermoactinomyces daqus]
MLQTPMTTTEEKILTAAIELMAEKDYQAVTTKEIAKAANVSEMTLFRHFGSKMNLLEAAVERFSIIVPLWQTVEKQISWNLEADLLLIAQLYQSLIRQNKKAFTVLYKESKHFPHLKEKVMYKNPVSLKNHLVEYFREMQARGQMIDVNPEVPAVGFLYMNLNAVLGINDLLSQLDESEFILQAVRIFARGLKA